MLIHVFTQAPADTRSRRYTVYTCNGARVIHIIPRPVAWPLLAIACGLVGLVGWHSRLVPQVLAQVLASVRWSAVGGRLRGMDAAGRDQTYRKSYTFVFMNTAVFSVCSLEAVIRG